ncbi:enolase-phosphatase E1 [Umbelopsis sp. WA50703]
MAATLPKELDLENLLHLENMFQELGHEDGMRDGKRSGVIEGRVLGCEKGFEISNEVGFYMGCATLWTQLVSANPEAFSSRAIKQIQSLQSAVDQFPDANEDQTDTFALLDKMRAKFRVVTSVLKVEQKFSTTQPTGMSY